MADLGGKAGGAGRFGWVKVSDVAATAGDDVVDTKVFDASGTILQSCRSSSLNVDVTVRASYPEVTVGVTVAQLTQSTDGGHYEGTVSAVLPAAGTISVVVTSPDGAAGASDSFDLTLEAAPQILTLSFTGGYPGAQTELKAGDTYQVTGTTDKNLDAVFVADSGVGTGELVTGLSGTAFTATVTVADRGTSVQALAASLQARDASTGALGAARATNELGGTTDGVDLVFLNNFFFSFAYGAKTYPLTQGALKGSEQATVAVTTDYVAAGANTIQYTSPGAELSITNPTVNEGAKTVTRIGGTYNVGTDGGTDNLSVALTRAANGAVTTVATVVNIANTPCSVTVTTSAGTGVRLRSGGNDGTTVQTYTITVTSDQELNAAPVMFTGPPNGSLPTFIGSWTGGPKVWTRDMEVHDDNSRGVKFWDDPSFFNLANVETTSIAVNPSYEVGGFVARTVTWQAFQTTSDNVSVAIADFSKVQAGIFSATSNQSIKQPLATPPPVTDGYTVSVVGFAPHQVEWLDTVAAGSNSGTAFLFDYEEVA